jgi:hypothetical protein
VRLFALWLLLFAVYLVGNEPPTSEELDYLRIATTLVHDGELVRSPLGLGFPLLIAPLEGLGDEAVAVVLAAVAAFGFVLAALLARRIVPEPYASAGAGLAGLSVPAVASAATILPAATAGTLLAGAALCAVAAPRRVPVFGAAALLATLPWLDPRLIVPAVPVAAALYLWCRQGRRATVGLIAVELVAASVVLYVTLNEQLYGGPTPWSALPSTVSATGADTVAEYLERLPRLVTVPVELLRWAPAFALVLYAAWLLRRSRAEELARIVPERAGAEAAAGLALAVVATVLLVAAFLVPTADDRYLVPALPVAGALVAWGLRHAPRVGAALAVATLALSAYETLTR